MFKKAIWLVCLMTWYQTEAQNRLIYGLYSNQAFADVIDKPYTLKIAYPLVVQYGANLMYQPDSTKRAMWHFHLGLNTFNQVIPSTFNSSGNLMYDELKLTGLAIGSMYVIQGKMFFAGIGPFLQKTLTLRYFHNLEDRTYFERLKSARAFQLGMQINAGIRKNIPDTNVYLGISGNISWLPTKATGEKINFVTYGILSTLGLGF